MWYLISKLHSILASIGYSSFDRFYRSKQTQHDIKTVLGINILELSSCYQVLSSIRLVENR